MDNQEDPKIAEYEEKVSYLSKLHAHILFWMMRGFGYDDIGRLLTDQRVIYQKWDGDTVQRELTNIYKALEIPNEWAPKTKNTELKKYALPAIKTLTNDDPKELDKFPLKTKPVNAQNRQSVDNNRRWIDKYRQYWWVPVAGILLLVLLVGVFLLGRGTAPPVATTAPTQEVGSDPASQPTADGLPSETIQPPLPTDTRVPTNTPSPTPTSEPTSAPASTVLFEDNFDGELKDVWKSPVYGDIPIITEDDRRLTFRGPTKFVLGDLTWINYEVGLSMTGHNCQGFVGSNTLTIGLRQQPSGEMIAFRWFHQDDGCLPVWLQGREDQWSVLAQDIFPLPPRNESGSRMIAITAQGDNFQTSYGGLISVSGFPNGGVVIIADDGVMIDNLVIRALP
jgi:hypothetical protein